MPARPAASGSKVIQSPGSSRLGLDLVLVSGAGETRLLFCDCGLERSDRRPAVVVRGISSMVKGQLLLQRHSGGLN